MNRKELEKEINKKQLELDKLKEELNTFKKYETIILVQENIKHIDYFKMHNQIKDIMGEIENIEELGIKKLAYKIKENEQAIYVLFHWIGNENLVSDFEKYAREEDNILKFITVRVYDEDEEEEEE